MKLFMIPVICLFNYAIENNNSITYTSTYSLGYIINKYTHDTGHITYNVDFTETIRYLGLNNKLNPNIKYNINKNYCRILL